MTLQWLSLGNYPREYDESGCGPGDDKLGMVVEMPTENGINEATQVGWGFYRTCKLIEHFNIMFQCYELDWLICHQNNNGISSLHKFSYYTL